MSSRLLPAAIGLVCAAAGLWLAVDLVPADLPTPQDPTFVDVGGVFIIGSTITRMSQGDWLKRAGPFEVSEHNSIELARERDFWRSVAEDSHRRLIELENQLNTSPDIEADML